MSLPDTEIILALGSNCGNRLFNIRQAIKMLPLHKKKLSYIYESDALLPNEAPPSWNRQFLNMAVSGYISLEPLALLNIIKNIEKNLGRDNTKLWSPRPIDIDIVFWGNQIIKLPNLFIPHNQMHLRDFVLVPICDIHPNFIHPILNISVQDILSKIINIQEKKLIRKKYHTSIKKITD